MAFELNNAAFLDDLRHLLESTGDVCIAVAFATSPGLNEIRQQLIQRLESGGSIRILLDLQEGATDPTALWDLLTLAAKYSYRLQLRAYVPDRGILHSKLFINVAGPETTVLTGSANLSRAAFHDNEEHGLRVFGARGESPISDAILKFEDLWASDKAFTIDEGTARLYEIYCDRRRALLNRTNRRSRAAWNDLMGRFARGPSVGFEWPSPGAAYVLGAIAARGYLYPASSRITIRLHFRPTSYQSGRISVWDLSYEAAAVIPMIPLAIMERAQMLFADAPITVEGSNVQIDLRNHPEIFDTIEGLFVPEKSCHSFGLPPGLASSDDGVVMEFVKGFAVASGLLTDGTSMPGDRTTGLPGQMTVWLRPKKGNSILFEQLYQLITRRLGITVYRHWREDREPHLKLICEDFAEVGFGIEWWDELVNRGSDYNQALLVGGAKKP